MFMFIYLCGEWSLGDDYSYLLHRQAAIMHMAAWHRMVPASYRARTQLHSLYTAQPSREHAPCHAHTAHRNWLWRGAFIGGWPRWQKPNQRHFDLIRVHFIHIALCRNGMRPTRCACKKKKCKREQTRATKRKNNKFVVEMERSRRKMHLQNVLCQCRSHAPLICSVMADCWILPTQRMQMTVEMCNWWIVNCIDYWMVHRSILWMHQKFSRWE